LLREVKSKENPMSTTRFALILGIGFLVVGIAGFVPGLLSPMETDLAVNAMSGRLLGLFPVNILHSLFHVVFGIWGIAAYRSWSGARAYCRVTAVVYAVLVVCGLIPGLSTFFGLIPLHGHDIWLHALIAIPAAYFGWAATAPANIRDAEAGGYAGRR
jgi:hypothetical protein